MLPELQTLREVQTLDMRIAGVDQELALVPGKLGAIDSEIAEARALWTDAVEQLQKVGADRRKAEGELEDAEAAVAKYRDQLLAARSNVEYSGLQQQIASRKKAIGDIEERILELMDAGDELSGRVKERERDFGKHSADLEAQKARVRSEAEALESRREGLARRRAAAISKLPDEVAARYERIRQAKDGLALSRARGERCSACSVRLRPQLFQQIRVGDSLIVCESCSRILFFEPDPAARAE